jgi:sulfur-oxidizing protein SoxY
MLAFMLAGLPRVGRSRSKHEMGGKLATAIDREASGHKVSTSGLVKLETPDIAEDGAIVPITIESELPNVETIWVFVEKNPSPLAARFDLEKSLAPFVSLRIKMNESCDVIAMVKSGDGYFSTGKNVTVVAGGCG